MFHLSKGRGPRVEKSKVNMDKGGWREKERRENNIDNIVCITCEVVGDHIK